MHALIIEPQAFTACAIEFALRDIGYTTFDFAVGAEEAVAAAAAHRPDLVTSAVTLEPGCGITAVQEICRDHDTPALFITQATNAVIERQPHAHIVRKQPFCGADIASAVAAARLLR